MKKNTYECFLFLVVLMTFSSYAQKQIENQVIVSQSIPSLDQDMITLIKYGDNINAPLTSKEKAQIDEAYGDKADEYIYSNGQNLKLMKQLLRNRIKISQTDNPNFLKKGKFLSEVPLFDYFNKTIKREAVFNLETFNPLCYRLDFFSKGNYFYRIDNTNYYIEITSQYRQ